MVQNSRTNAFVMVVQPYVNSKDVQKKRNVMDTVGLMEEVVSVVLQGVRKFLHKVEHVGLMVVATGVVYKTVISDHIRNLTTIVSVMLI
jgi:hypothetical protein